MYYIILYMTNYNKYLKYKNKYLKLKNNLIKGLDGGSGKGKLTRMRTLVDLRNELVSIRDKKTKEHKNNVGSNYYDENMDNRCMDSYLNYALTDFEKYISICQGIVDEIKRRTQELLDLGFDSKMINDELQRKTNLLAKLENNLKIGKELKDIRDRFGSIRFGRDNPINRSQDKDYKRRSIRELNELRITINDTSGNPIDITIEFDGKVMVDKYIEGNDCVLELGARYGSVSCIINRKLNNKTHQLSVDPDINIIGALTANRNNNACGFHILNAFISNTKLSLVTTGDEYGKYATPKTENQSKYDESSQAAEERPPRPPIESSQAAEERPPRPPIESSQAAEEQPPRPPIESSQAAEKRPPIESDEVETYTLAEVIKRYPDIENFDVLIADCEGFLPQFILENIEILDRLRLIIFEKDYYSENLYAYEEMKAIFRLKGFNLVEIYKGQYVYKR